ncbi:hypothetical protein SDJN02_00030, partial [Cucurbita argyrosperma subsp. argyrosperma]
MTEEDSVKRKVKQIEGDINEAENVRNGVNKGAWTAEEDQKLAEVIAIHGAKRWKTIAAKADTELREEETSQEFESSSNLEFDVDNLFDFSNEGPDLEWMTFSKYLVADELVPTNLILRMTCDQL